MDSLNTILNSGTYGENVSRHNDNNSKIKQAITTLENVAIANKGYFDTLASLQAAFPSPKAGNIAYVANVASSTGYYIYNVVSGVWTATTTEAPAVGVEISNYAQHGYSSNPKTLKQVDDEVVQLAVDINKLKNRVIEIKYIGANTPELQVGEAYLHEANKEIMVKVSPSTNVAINMVEGNIVIHKGVRYIKTPTGWDAEKTIANKIQTIGGVYLYDSLTGDVSESTLTGLRAKIDVIPGDLFYIRGRGGDNARLYIYKDLAGNTIDVAAPTNLLYVNIPYAFICKVAGTIYLNFTGDGRYTYEAYSTGKVFIPVPDPKITNTIVINSISGGSAEVPNYNEGNYYFNTGQKKIYQKKDGVSVDVTRSIIENDYDIYNKYDGNTYKYRNNWLVDKHLQSTSWDSFLNEQDMVDVSADHSTITYDNTIMSQLYSKYDSLVASYPEYVSRVDAADLVGLIYPEYANGIIAGHGTYLETPAYKTYMYKFIDNNVIAGNEHNNRKYRIFIISAAHGQERLGAVTAWMFLKRLCENMATDYNFFLLRSTFDIYVVPCLNGYGLFHNQRNNANNVNLNRNYPTKHWVSGVPGDDYGGDSAGSEFETQIVVKLTDMIKPHFPIDLHNYGNGASQVYTIPRSEIAAKLSYRILSDISQTLIKSMPNYFGTKHNLFVGTARQIRPVYPYDYPGMSGDFWFYERKNLFGSTFEVSNGINFTNGIFSAGVQHDVLGNTTASIAEYTLRKIIYTHANYILQNQSNEVSNWRHFDE